MTRIIISRNYQDEVFETVIFNVEKMHYCTAYAFFAALFDSGTSFRFENNPIEEDDDKEDHIVRIPPID